jgi:hypothetical protein
MAGPLGFGVSVESADGRMAPFNQSGNGWVLDGFFGFRLYRTHKRSGTLVHYRK